MYTVLVSLSLSVILFLFIEIDIENCVVMHMLVILKNALQILFIKLSILQIDR